VRQLASSVIVVVAQVAILAVVVVTDGLKW
jgi:hypothetical protein